MSTMFVKSYIEFLFNIKNNSIYISENRERLFVFKTSLEVLDTQLHRVIEMGSLHEGGLCLCITLRMLEMTQPTNAPPATRTRLSSEFTSLITIHNSSVKKKKRNKTGQPRYKKLEVKHLMNLHLRIFKYCLYFF